MDVSNGVGCGVSGFCRTSAKDRNLDPADVSNGDGCDICAQGDDIGGNRGEGCAICVQDCGMRMKEGNLCGCDFGLNGRSIDVPIFALSGNVGNSIDCTELPYARKRNNNFLLLSIKSLYVRGKQVVLKSKYRYLDDLCNFFVKKTCSLPVFRSFLPLFICGIIG